MTIRPPVDDIFTLSSTTLACHETVLQWCLPHSPNELGSGSMEGLLRHADGRGRVDGIPGKR